MFNYHVASLPMVTFHADLAQFNMISKLQDVLCTLWNNTLIDGLSEGARNMTGDAQGVVARLRQVSIKYLELPESHACRINWISSWRRHEPLWMKENSGR